MQLSSNKNIDTKIKITEVAKLLTVNIEILSKNYKNYLSDNNILNVIGHTSAKNEQLILSNLHNRSQIKTQKKLINLKTQNLQKNNSKTSFNSRAYL